MANTCPTCRSRPKPGLGSAKLGNDLDRIRAALNQKRLEQDRRFQNSGRLCPRSGQCRTDVGHPLASFDRCRARCRARNDTWIGRAGAPPSPTIVVECASREFSGCRPTAESMPNSVDIALGLADSCPILADTGATPADRGPSCSSESVARCCPSSARIRFSAKLGSDPIAPVAVSPPRRTGKAGKRPDFGRL